LGSYNPSMNTAYSEFIYVVMIVLFN
jgi:hypothetical protein